MVSYVSDGGVVRVVGGGGGWEEREDYAGHEEAEYGA